MAQDPMSLDGLSGPWTAIWQQGRDRGQEHLDLVFLGGNAMGLGSDRDGDFQYGGTYDAGGSVVLGKTYTRPTRPVPARMTYTGRWDGRRILGVWTDDRYPSNQGPFRMWPGTGPDPGEVLEHEADLPAEEALVLMAPRPVSGDSQN